MIASRKHSFIFIKTMKTAGTSVELALSPHCGPEDVITPISTRHDLQRLKDDGVAPRNFAPADVVDRYRKALKKGNPKLIKRALREDRGRLDTMRAHVTCRRVREFVGEDFWRAAFKFAVERHPYEKAVSLAAMNGLSIADTAFFDLRYVGYRSYTINDRVAVDYIIRFADLADDMQTLMARFGMPWRGLPHARATNRDRRPAREQLSLQQRLFIYEMCALEFELFGWER